MAKAKKFIQKAIKHPGALTAAAERHGRTTMEEAKVEAKSSDKSIRSRGLLGERLIRSHGGKRSLHQKVKGQHEPHSAIGHHPGYTHKHKAGK